MGAENEPEQLSHRTPDGLPHRGFLTLEAPAGAFAGVSLAAQRRRARRAQLTAGLAAVVAIALTCGAAAVSGLRPAEEQALVPVAAPPRLAAATPPVPDRDSSVPPPVTASADAGPTSAGAVPTTSASSVASSPTPSSSTRTPSAASVAPPTSSSSGTGLALTVPGPTSQPVALSSTGCVAVGGRAVDSTGAPLADLVVARFLPGTDGKAIVTVAGRTGDDGRFTVPPGGSLMLSTTAPGAPQTRATKNLTPVWVGGGSFPGNPATCATGPDTVLSPGATLVGDYVAPVYGSDLAAGTVTVAASAVGSPLALAPVVAATTKGGYRLVGLPVGVGAVLIDAFDHRRAFDVAAGSGREDWSSCTTCIAGMPARGGAAQVDPTAPPSSTPTTPVPTSPLPTAPTPTDLPTPTPAPTSTPTPTGTPTAPAGTPTPSRQPNPTSLTARHGWTR